MALALARVSTFFVAVVISNGPSDELEDVSFGKFLNSNVILVVPVCDIKSGIYLLIFIYFQNRISSNTLFF